VANNRPGMVAPYQPRAAAPSQTRAALYVRVSTGRQAQHELSIPDQRMQLTSWCCSRGWSVIAEFVEVCTATDDRRQGFQEMIEFACDPERTFDVIVVHSYSRFFRDSFEKEFYLRKLAKHDVKVISITQPVGDDHDPVQVMMRKIIALFDEYQSKENAKHVLRAMKENARQGFWNGATCPLGYHAMAAEMRGTKTKRKLEINPVEAEIVRLIYKLYHRGNGMSGAMGIKEIVQYLNAQGYRTRRGKTFGVGNLHKILTNTVYIGRWLFNQKSSKTGRKKPPEEIIEVTVPQIIEPSVFEQVQRQLHARSPRIAAPRVTTGPILLTGIAICATCRGGMMLRTGTSRSGKIYRYYTCSTCTTRGKSVCKGRSVPMYELDELIIEYLKERLFRPDRLAAILSSLSSRWTDRTYALNARMMAQREVTESEDKLKRLYTLVEQKLTELDDILRDRLNVVKAHHARATAAFEQLRRQAAPAIQLDPNVIERFGKIMRENLGTGSLPFCKEYLRALIEAIEVNDDGVRIKGRKDLPNQAV
jgi:site-specific DNA recombinase